MKIEVQNLGFGYKDERVLRDINLIIDKPGLICIIGPNGVGKSTLVKCLLNLLKYTDGVITIDGTDAKDLSAVDRARMMGYVPVGSEDTFSRTVLDLVLMGRHPHQQSGDTDKDLDWEIAMRSLNMMDVVDLAMKDSNELSAGQKQRVAIAKGLAQTPRVLVLDEPTANLDPRHQLRVTEKLKEISIEIGMTIIMISHDLNTAAKYADEIIMMALPGVVYEVGTPEKVLTAENIQKVYGVECSVIDNHGRPHVILERPLGDEEYATLVKSELTD